MVILLDQLRAGRLKKLGNDASSFYPMALSMSVASAGGACASFYDTALYLYTCSVFLFFLPFFLPCFDKNIPLARYIDFLCICFDVDMAAFGNYDNRFLLTADRNRVLSKIC